MTETQSESLTLKWGTLKGWDLKGEETLAALRRYHELGASMSAAAQRDTPEQKALICEIIDKLDGPIDNDWSGETMTKEEAKRYVLEYRTPWRTPAKEGREWPEGGRGWRRPT